MTEIIEIAERIDLEEILKLQKLAYQENAVRYNDEFIPPLTQTLDNLYEEAESSTILKVVTDDLIVGSIRGVLKDGTCILSRLFVHPNYQNRGLGRKLIEAIEKQFSVERYEIYTGHLDDKNLALYEKLGYKRFKTNKFTDSLEFIYLEKVDK